MNIFVVKINCTYLEEIIGYLIYYISIAGFSLLSAVLAERVKRNTRIYIGIVVAMICVIISIIFDNLTFFIVYAFLSGLSFGIGLPPCFGYFAERTTVQNRGRNSAVIFFLLSLIFVIIAIVLKSLGKNFLTAISITLLGVVLVTALNVKEDKENEVAAGKKTRFISIISNKYFLFYFISSSIFCLIDALETPILENFLSRTFGEGFRDVILSTETFFTAFSALAAGFLADLYGRKKITIYGFIASGIAYATVGVASPYALSWYLYAIVDGIALGFFVVILIFTVLGDISTQNASEKYYALGSLPFFLVGILLKIVGPYVEIIPVNASFSFASFFLFLAVLPLMYAPETLPEKLIRRRELREYVEKAKKIREKYEKEKD